MIDDETLDLAIWRAARSASLPFRAGRTLEQQTTVWIHQAAVRHALADLRRAILSPQQGGSSPAPEVAREHRERLIARSEADRSWHGTHLTPVPADIPGQMLAALVGIVAQAKEAIEEIDANTTLDGDHAFYREKRAKWQAVLDAVAAAEKGDV